ncbi:MULTISPECIES: lipid-A-disaccharide synthase [Roseobacteraceae]|uniref:lipid-A-disaccharide synthase n=1 Tax=Roseobacteraceae TaxID=2854170 RepID=UPI0013BE3DB2|nr:MULTISPECIES: lipid-A-disaccharide synthase [Roseobacteraceae]MCA0994774.1 lipid-A-disaccharide synthase [Alloyangia pacifica]NDV99261.1 lipid-A-disaccharide synthase [Salipiger sp. PrR002]NDW55747.1 lipid-A-disaccharide synthase [Salipiger sp. PrR004]
MKVFIIAGEPSGDRLGGALMHGLKARVPDVSFEGIGGERMLEEGLQSLFPMDEISIMGITEILRHYGALKARIRQTADAIVAAKPDVLITVDLPEFSLRVAKLVKERSDIRTVHYVAPTVWAWRPGRAAKMAKHIDQVLALLPFEPPYMEAAGMRCDFVGHPVVTDPQASHSEEAEFRLRHGIGDAPLCLILPGSRRSEISRLGPVFGEALEQLSDARPELRYVLPMAGPVADLVRETVADWPVDPILLDPRAQGEAGKAEKRAAFAAADVALAASGTVALELAAASTPMVVAYDMGWLSRQIISRLMLVDSVNLVNLVTGSRSVPEYVGDACRPGPIADAVLRVLDAPQEQIAAMRDTMEQLGKGGPPPGQRAADAVLDGIRQAG